MSSWDVIFWDDSVDYVPSSWGNDKKDRYVWPAHIKSQIKIRQMIKDCENPTIDGKWIEHPAQFKKRTNSVVAAEEYSRKYCYVSDLTTTDDEISSNPPTPENTDLHRTPDDESHKIDKNSKQSVQRNDSSSPSIVIELPNSQKASNTSDPMIKMLENITDLRLNHRILHHDVLLIKGLLEKLVAGDERFNNLVQSKFELPLKDDDTLNATEEQLAQDPNNINNLAHELSLAGGENQHKAILQIMKKLITKDLSILYSSKGRKGKKDFSKLKICEAVIRSVRIRFPTATDTEIFKDIGAVLATAGDRDGGRKQRGRVNNQK